MQESADLVTFTEEILTAKLHFLCSDVSENIKNVLSSRLYEKHCFKKEHSWEVFHFQITAAAVRRCSSKKVFVKILQISQEKICVRAFRPATLLKRDSSTVAFL